MLADMQTAASQHRTSGKAPVTFTRSALPPSVHDGATPKASPKAAATPAEIESFCVDREGVPFYLIRADSKFKVNWDILAIVVLLYTIVILPLRMGFKVEDFCPEPIWMWEFFIDLVFLFDLLLNFVTAFHTTKLTAAGEAEWYLETRLWPIARHYLKGWFVLDLLSSVPLDTFMTLQVQGCGRPIVGDASGAARGPGALQIVRILRLCKLPKILRVLKLQARLEELQNERFPNLATSQSFALLQTLFVCLYIAHLLACGFYGVGQLQCRDPAMTQLSGPADVAASYAAGASSIVNGSSVNGSASSGASSSTGKHNTCSSSV